MGALRFIDRDFDWRLMREFVADPVLVDSLRKHVDVLSDLIGPRHLGRMRALDDTVTYIEHVFAELGEPVARESYDVGRQTVHNLVLERRGTRQPEEIVVIGAHYDTVPETPGADDNASAVAMLLEVARLTQGRACGRTLRFVSFPCEEPPHFYTQTMGSEVYAQGCRARGEQIVGMICLEMVGYYLDTPGSQDVPPAIPFFLRWLFPSRGDFLAAVSNLRSWRFLRGFRRGFKRATGLRLFAIALPEWVHEIRLSDNSSFWDNGYPALMVTDTSFLRNPHYHAATDTAETLDYERLAAATVGVVGAVEEVTQ
jgi:hypothetical protein